MSHILRRIEREAGIPNLVDIISDKISAADLQSLLIEAYRRIAKRRTPASILSDYARNRFAQPSALDPSLLLECDKAAFSHLPKSFQAIELSPIIPLGSVSAIAPVSQDWIQTTIRNTEVIADPTNALALECAARRQKRARLNPNDDIPVRLACSHRVLRAQRYQNPKSLQHFRLFSLCSAGRDTGGFLFEQEALTEHLRFYLQLITNFLGPDVLKRVALENFSRNSRLAQVLSGVLENLKSEFPRTTMATGDSESEKTRYYQQFRFHIHASRGEDWIELVDGGDTNWTRKLLNNQKERLVTSAIGSERLCAGRPSREESV